MFAPIWNEVKEVNTRDIFKNILFKSSILKYKNINNLTQEDYINLSLYFEAKTFLHGLLVVEDKLSMAHSLETRVPFLDNDLVDLAQKIPITLKLNIKNIQSQKTNDGKIILRKVMRKYIPETICNDIKQGFSSPDNSWFKGDSIEFVKTKILNKNANIYDFFDFNSVNKLINEHLEGKINRRLFIWSLLNFEEWLTIYK